LGWLELDYVGSKRRHGYGEATDRKTSIKEVGYS
jgi:hypothetical protein